MLELTQSTPCQASKHGSPPCGIQPGNGGLPRAAYRLLIAKTDAKKYILPNTFWVPNKQQYR